jgi:hypothetical protein
MRASITLRATAAVLALGVGTLAAGDSAAVDARAALERIKALVGAWDGHISTPDGPPGSVRYELTGGGHTVVERLFPGSEHEMMTVYHLDGDRLLATHFCAMGNQPVMKLEKATTDELSFGFAGGTNMDAGKDVHIHSGRLRFTAGGGLESEWDVFRGSQHTMTHKFFLARKP